MKKKNSKWKNPKNLDKAVYKRSPKKNQKKVNNPFWRKTPKKVNKLAWRSINMEKRFQKAGRVKGVGTDTFSLWKKGDAYLIAYRIQTLTGRTCINIEFYEQESCFDGLAWILLKISSCGITTFITLFWTKTRYLNSTKGRVFHYGH